MAEIPHPAVEEGTSALNRVVLSETGGGQDGGPHRDLPEMGISPHAITYNMPGQHAMILVQ